jgi:hypothetical protein
MREAPLFSPLSLSLSSFDPVDDVSKWALFTFHSSHIVITENSPEVFPESTAVPFVPAIS